MTETVTTERKSNPSDGVFGAPSSHLTGVKITPVMLASAQGAHAIREAIGMQGTAVQFFEAYTEPHAHTDGGLSVSTLPDIVAGDRLIADGVTYTVRWCEKQPATTSTLATLLIYLTEDKRR